MSKVDELKIKFKTISEKDFNFFVESDTTPTKKYLEYMLSVWSRRRLTNYSTTKKGIVKDVFEFDTLIDYIKNKDIYDKSYTSLIKLEEVIEKAKELKEEKTFDKSKEAIILEETDEHVLLVPLTHKASLKYGSNTKWCTASKSYPGNFTSYSKDCLIYLVDKTNTKKNNTNKIAFYIPLSANINSGYQVFNELDRNVDLDDLIKYGWKREDIFRFDYYARNYRYNKYDMKITKEKVDRVVSFMKNIDFDEFNENLKKMKIDSKFDSTEIKTTFENFYLKIKALETY